MSLEKTFNTNLCEEGKTLSNNLSQQQIPVERLLHMDLLFKKLPQEDLNIFFKILCEIRGLTHYTQKYVYFECFNTVSSALSYMANENEIIYDIKTFEEHLILTNIIKMYKTRRDFPSHIRAGLRSYLVSLPGFQESAPKQSEITEQACNAITLHIKSLLNDLPIQKLLTYPEITHMLKSMIHNLEDEKSAQITYLIDNIKYNNNLNAQAEKQLYDQVYAALRANKVEYETIEKERLMLSIYNKDTPAFLQEMDNYVLAYQKANSITASKQHLTIQNKIELFYDNAQMSSHYGINKSLIEVLLTHYDKELFFNFMNKYCIDFNIPLLNMITVISEGEEEKKIQSGQSLLQYALKYNRLFLKDMIQAKVDIWSSRKDMIVLNEKTITLSNTPFDLFTNENTIDKEDDIYFLIEIDTINKELINRLLEMKNINLFSWLLQKNYNMAFSKLVKHIKVSHPEFSLKEFDNGIHNTVLINNLSASFPKIDFGMIKILVSEKIMLLENDKTKEFLSQCLQPDQPKTVSDKLINLLHTLSPMIPSTYKTQAPLVLIEEKPSQEIKLETTDEEKASNIVWIDLNEVVMKANNAKNEKASFLNKLSSKAATKSLLRVEDETFFETLQTSMPNFKEVIDYYKGQFRQNHYANKKRINPILLLGEPGIGKTYFAKQLARFLNTDYEFIDMGSLSAGWVLTGMDGTWQDAKAGRILRLMMKSTNFNPIVLLDEIDKVNSNRYDPTAALYQLLEEVNAKEVVDEFAEVSFNASGIIYVACANSINTLSEPLLSRFKVFTVPSPNNQQLELIIQNIYQEAMVGNKLVEPVLNNEIIEMCKNHSLREIKVMIEEGISHALLQYTRAQLDEIENNNEKITLKKDDFKTTHKKFQLGF